MHGSLSWFNRTHQCAALAAFSWLLVACHTEQGAEGGPADPAQRPPLVTVVAGSMQSGFSTGTLRGERRLSPYRITKHPVTWLEYDGCAHAGACGEPDASACGKKAYAPYSGYKSPDYAGRAEKAPAVCVGEQQAESYCRWIGGHLPTLDQWLLAARGTGPRRFSWGDAPTSCAQHPMAPQLLAKQHADDRRSSPPGATGMSCAPDKFDGSELSVLKHSDGASPAGLEDVMLAPGELLGSDAQSIFNACGEGRDHCVVYGLQPAAIDSVEPFFQVPIATTGEIQRVQPVIAHAYSFRCVVDGDSEGRP
jgi:hypothetical protein